ncbi:MAG: hypothetical protein CVV49_13150 [Spirochaetae bacterium HGW-Spirochaetae-5]|nr:MAG: hypothetical protein CVV49_13150 [Spirochaetae bacterium HGW-Spirochaetae-5]
MFKNRILFLLPVCISGFIVLSALSAYPETAGLRYVIAEKGLKMRETPSVSGREITLIPHNSEVEFIEEQPQEVTIAGTRGKWTMVSWKGRKGWVFGGFLSSLKIDKDKSVLIADGEWWELINIKGKDVIFKPCSADTRSVRLNMAEKSIHHSLGQEDLYLDIVSVEKGSDGIINFKVKSEGAEPYTVTLEIPKKGKAVIWGNLNGMGSESRYVETKHLSGYKTVLENGGNCDE